MKALSLTLAAAVALAGVGATVAPPGWRHWQLFEAADDPVGLSRLRLDETLSQDRITTEIDAALAARDPELAESFAALATQRGFVVTPAQRQRLSALNDGGIGRAVEDFGHGLFKGDRESGAAFAGALVGDVTGVGDVRDIADVGRKWLDGEELDVTVLALAAGGLALSAATWISLGSAMPARNGLSLVKSASKARLMSPALTASLARAATEAVHRPAVTASLAAAGRLELGAFRMAASRIVKPQAVARLAALGEDAGTLYARTGQRGLRQVLAVADEAGDIGRASRLAAAEGSTMRATLKLLGRGALVLGAFSLTALGWIAALVGYALALAMLAQRLGWWLGRRRKPATA